MITTIAALTLLCRSQAAMNLSLEDIQDGGVFPVPTKADPAIQSNSKLFTYFIPGQLVKFGVSPDWSPLKVPELAPDARKLKVLALVQERDFTTDQAGVILEDRDKQRLLAGLIRVQALFQIQSGGKIALEIIPRFVAEPFLNKVEIDKFLTFEYNLGKFDADDSVERGPFDAVLSLSSATLGRLGVSGSDPVLETNLYHKIEDELVRRVITERIGATLEDYPIGPKSQRATDLSWRISPFTGEKAPLLSSTFRLDTELLRKTIADLPSGGNIETTSTSVGYYSPMANGPVQIAVSTDNELSYTEASIMRAGSYSLPSIQFKQDAPVLSFDVKTTAYNPLEIRIGDSGFVFGAGNAQLPILPDGTWQTISVPLFQTTLGTFAEVRIGAPEALVGHTRGRTELTQYFFRNFRIGNEAATPIQNTEGGVWTGSNVKSKARQYVESLNESNTDKSARTQLMDYSMSLDPWVAYWSVIKYGQTGITEDDADAKANIQRLLIASPNEFAREAALEVAAKYPYLATFETISPSTVRKSWRTRLASVKALVGLQSTEQKAKPAARQLLLSATFQDYAIIRAEALKAMDPKVEDERKRLEYGVVNDPSEQVRLICLTKLAAEPTIPKETLAGAFADESPFVRMSIPKALSSRPDFQREACRQLVVDLDPYVRAAALHALLELKNVQAGEVQNLFVDTHPRIELELAVGASKGLIQLPTEIVKRLKTSPSKVVRKAAEGIK